MKRILIIFSALIVTISTSAQSKQEAGFKVWGNCGMCEKTIETAAKIEGVSLADWDKTTKMMKVVFDSKKTNLKAIKQKIAAKGYDTDEVKATDEAYSQLHSCCRYEREGSLKAGENQPKECCEKGSHEGSKEAKCCEAGNQSSSKSCCQKKS